MAIDPNTSKIYNELHVKAIADAIRDRNESDETYTIAEMDPAIRALDAIDHEDFIEKNIMAMKREMTAEGVECDDSVSGIVFYNEDGSHAIYASSKRIKIVVEFDATRSLGLHVYRVSFLSGSSNDGTICTMPWNPVYYDDEWKTNYPLAADGVAKYGVQELTDTTYEQITRFNPSAFMRIGYSSSVYNNNVTGVSYIGEPGLLEKNFKVYGGYDEDNTEFVNDLFYDEDHNPKLVNFNDIIGRNISIGELIGNRVNYNSMIYNGDPISDMPADKWNVHRAPHTFESDISDIIVFKSFTQVNNIWAWRLYIASRVNYTWANVSTSGGIDTFYLMGWPRYNHANGRWENDFYNQGGINNYGSIDTSEFDFQNSLYDYVGPRIYYDRLPSGIVNIYRLIHLDLKSTCPISLVGTSFGNNVRMFCSDGYAIRLSDSAEISNNALTKILEDSHKEEIIAGQMDINHNVQWPTDAEDIIYNTANIMDINSTSSSPEKVKYIGKDPNSSKELYSVMDSAYLYANINKWSIIQDTGIGDRDNYIYRFEQSGNVVAVRTDEHGIEHEKGFADTYTFDVSELPYFNPVFQRYDYTTDIRHAIPSDLYKYGGSATEVSITKEEAENKLQNGEWVLVNDF